MPHAIIECSESLLKIKSADEIMQNVFDSFTSIGVFNEEVIQVRLQPFQYYKSLHGKQDFIHVIAHIKAGRTLEKRQELSKNVVSGLYNFFPDVPFISTDVIEMDSEVYANKSSILQDIQ